MKSAIVLIPIGVPVIIVTKSVSPQKDKRNSGDGGWNGGKASEDQVKDTQDWVVKALSGNDAGKGSSGWYGGGTFEEKDKETAGWVTRTPGRNDLDSGKGQRRRQCVWRLRFWEPCYGLNHVRGLRRPAVCGKIWTSYCRTIANAILVSAEWAFFVLCFQPRMSILFYRFFRPQESMPSKDKSRDVCLARSSRGLVHRFSTGTVRAKPSDPPPATSTSAAQPFSTPFTPSPSKTPNIPPGTSSKSQEPAKVSSVPAGTPLKGLGYMKGQEAPLAKEDAEYPSWLWGLLDTSAKSSQAEGEVGDAFAKSKKQRRLASKAARALKTGNHAALHTVKVPLEEQSIDLPAGMEPEEGAEAQEAREDLRLAMRKARRKKIKENNFLRGMR
ncbi:hypothetical protein ACLMJK_002755 [Lecanora helva]